MGSGVAPWPSACCCLIRPLRSSLLCSSEMALDFMVMPLCCSSSLQHKPHGNLLSIGCRHDDSGGTRTCKQASCRQMERALRGVQEPQLPSQLG